MSTSIDPLVVRNTPVERRFYPRITPSVPIYVAFGPNNLGTLLNVGENGFQVVTPNRLDPNSVYRVFLPLDGISSTITVSVRTIWTADSQNSSGIQLLDLSEQDRQQIRRWVALQTSQSENLEHWFSPKNGEPVAPAPEQPWPAAEEFSAPTPEPAPSTETEPPPIVAKSTIKHEFPPMPLPIHGEFTYEPPSDREKKILLRRERASRSRSRSPISALILWTLFMSAICVAAGWSFQHKLSGMFLRRSTQVALEKAQPPDTPPSLVAPDAPALPTSEATSGATLIGGEHGQANADGIDVNKNPDHAATATSIAPAQTAAPKPFRPASSTAKHLAANVSASKPNLASLPNHSAQPEAPEVSHPYVADSVPPLIPANSAIPARVPATEPAPVMSASNGNAPAPSPTPKTNAAPPPQAATIPTSRRSAITGSISNSSRPGDSFVAKPSDSVASAPSASQQPSMLRANSFAARNSNSGYSSPGNPAPPNPAVIQMDVPEARVIEVTPPRSLTGNLTASFVNLPGERVLRSTSLTMHIARSVQVPGERIPGQRWLWRGHKKVVLGELASRVDPQASSLSVPYGSITVLATIDREGYVSNVKPLYGSMAFLPKVAAAVRDWRYQPTYLDNKPVDTQAQIEIDFHPPANRASKP
jgi:hypothetical protein